MRSLFQTLSLALVAALLIRSAYQYRADFLLKSATSAWKGIESDVRRRDPLSGERSIIWSPQAGEALDKALLASSVWVSGPDANRLSASILQAKAEQEIDVTERLSLFCRSLDQYGAALQKNQTDAGLLVNWASIRQLLGSTPCTNGITEGDFRKVIDLALTTAPSNSNVIFSAALISVWSGDHDTALKLFNKVLLYGMPLTAGQRALILNEIESGKDFKTLVPARFPQIVDWSVILKERRPQDFEQWSDAIGQLQVAAIRLAVNEFETGQVPENLHESRLISINGSIASPQARRELDVMLSRFASTKNNRELSEYLSARSGKQEIPIYAAVIRGDTRAATTPLSRWGGNDEVFFDDFYQTVGFYLPDGKNIQLIELYPRRKSDGIDLGAIEVLVSDDNRRWERISNITPTKILIGQSELIGISIAEIHHHYWKVHFASASHGRTFQNDTSKIVRVLGSSTNDDQV